MFCKNCMLIEWVVITYCTIVEFFLNVDIIDGTQLNSKIPGPFPILSNIKIKSVVDC